MGLWSWIKDLVRQVVDDDLEGRGAHPAAPGAPRRARPEQAGPLLSERDVGAGPDEPSAAPPATQERGGRGGAADDAGDEAAAAAWVLHNQNQNRDDGRGRQR